MPGVDIKKDDHVRVMSGKDRGHTGRVLHVSPREGKVMVEGAARAKKHQRATGKRSTSGQQLQQGGIIDTELFIDISNVRSYAVVRQPPRGRSWGHQDPDMQEV
jgi:large subunit ribosomal protein L24